MLRSREFSGDGDFKREVEGAIRAKLESLFAQSVEVKLICSPSIGINPVSSMMCTDLL